MPCNHIGSCNISLNLHIRMSDNINQRFCCLGAHIADIDIHHSKLRFNDLGERIIIKSHDTNILRNFYTHVTYCINTSKGNIVVCADYSIRKWFLIE